MEPHFNWLAVVVAAFMPMVVGFIYYHPKVMGTAWMREAGLTTESIGNGPKPIMYGVALGLSFLLATWLSINVTGLGQEDMKYHTFQHGVAHAALLSLLVLLPIMGTNAIFEKRSFKLVFINLGYWFLAFAMSLVILSAWR
jgi:hypothetical protein